MCTVSFIPQSDSGFILTSNRDESPRRNTLPPASYSVNDTELIFPKDELAGGTWIGYSSRNRLICLLNGGFTAHERKESYRMSRGVIVTNLLTSLDATATIGSYDFSDIEPFTIVLVDWKETTQLHELVWDGRTAHFSEKPLAPSIWSSSLLYSEAMKKDRETWFSQFLFDTVQPSEEEVLNFHRNAGTGNPESDLIMDRGFVRTKSITSFRKKKKSAEMSYEDLEKKEITRYLI